MSLLDALVVMGETMRISVPEVVDAALGRVTVQVTDERLASWSRRVVERAEIRLRVHGGDKVDWARAYVVMSNHQSHMDIPVLYRVIHGSLRMVAKTELFKIPIFGRAMRDAGFVEIDRKDREKAIKQLDGAIAALRGGTHIWIAPEGTRSQDGRLGPLKKGGFRIAVGTGAPILPVRLEGTRDVLPRDHWNIRRGRTVDVTFGAPIESAGRTVDELMKAVEAFLAAGATSA